MRFRRSLLPVVMAFVVGSSCAVCSDANGDWSAKILVEQTGIYQITYEDLTAAGVLGGPLPSHQLRLSNRGEPVPIHLVDGGDRELGPGDAIEFAGMAIRGEGSYLYPYSRHNTYILDSSGGTAEYRELQRQSTRW